MSNRIESIISFSLTLLNLDIDDLVYSHIHNSYSYYIEKSSCYIEFRSDSVIYHFNVPFMDNAYMISLPTKSTDDYGIMLTMSDMFISACTNIDVNKINDFERVFNIYKMEI
jgi:hypothetical protein